MQSGQLLLADAGAQIASMLSDYLGNTCKWKIYSKTKEIYEIVESKSKYN